MTASETVGALIEQNLMDVEALTIGQMQEVQSYVSFFLLSQYSVKQYFASSIKSWE